MNWNYITAFFQTVVISCMHPLNWEACLPVQDWLFPAIGDYIRFKTEEPYASEQRILRSIQLDDRRAKP